MPSGWAYTQSSLLGGLTAGSGGGGRAAASSSSTSSAQLELIRRSGASVVHARPCEAKLPSSQGDGRSSLASCETRCELVEMRDGHIFVLDEPPPPPHTHAILFAPSHIPGDATPVSCPYIIDTKT